MKKVYALILALALFTGASQAQCVIDTTAQTTPGVTPAADQLPCIHKGVAYNQTLQVKIQSSYDTTFFSIETIHVTVDSVKIDSVTGLPAGIVFSHNPIVLLGGANGCGTFSGTTNNAPGQYSLTAWGTAWLHATGTSPFPIDTPYAYNGNLNQFSPFGDYYVTICDTVAANVNTINAELSAALSVSPNPNNGVFEVRFNGGSRINGDMKIVDVAGRVVYAQRIDVVGFYSQSVDLANLPKGLYTVQVRTAEGFAAKNISVE